MHLYSPLDYAHLARPRCVYGALLPKKWTGRYTPAAQILCFNGLIEIRASETSRLLIVYISRDDQTPVATEIDRSGVQRNMPPTLSIGFGGHSKRDPVSSRASQIIERAEKFASTINTVARRNARKPWLVDELNLTTNYRSFLLGGIWSESEKLWNQLIVDTRDATMNYPVLPNNLSLPLPLYLSAYLLHLCYSYGGKLRGWKGNLKEARRGVTNRLARAYVRFRLGTRNGTKRTSR